MSSGGPSVPDLQDFVRVFLDECDEHLGVLEQSLLELEHRGDDPELLSQLFRAAHSIKGGAATFGLAQLAGLTHALESLLDAARSHALAIRREVIDVLLRGTDAARALLAAAIDGSDAPETTSIIAACEALLAAPAAAPPPAAPAPAVADEYTVEIVLGRDAFRDGLDPMLALRELGERCEVLASEIDTSALPPLATLDPTTSYLGWRLRVRAPGGPDELHDIFGFVEMVGEVRIAPVAPAGPSATAAEAPTTGSAPAAPAHAAPHGEVATIRVAVDKVDKLMNLVGELVINQSMVTQLSQRLGGDDRMLLQAAISEMERNTRELQERVMSIRMVPIASIFARVPRLVRDLSSKLDRQVEVELVGEDTELDKGMIERLADPLIHLVRNAVDHGIEPADVRVAAGKPAHGTVTVTAYHRGGNVCIEVRDDGRGLDRSKIAARALERGLLAAHEELDDARVLDLICHPGFSTAAEISDVSGRGVGMDVVRSNIVSMNGSLSLESAPGQGTTMRIALPLTLAILDGLCLRAGASTYVLPLTAIVESLRLRPEQLRRVFGRGEVVTIRGETLPLVRLHDQLGIDGCVTDPYAGLVILIEDAGHKVGLLVDDITGQAQVVIKSLETHFRRVDGLAGATILGDGQVALILDVPRLVRTGRVPADAGARAHDGAFA